MSITNTATPTKRIEYIDALRGFTMILVVFHHVLLFSFNINDSLVNDIIVSFFMPLFFFISGLMGYKEGVVWNRKTWGSMTKSKIFGLLIPTLILGLIYTYAYRNLCFSSFVTDVYKLGYWFTITLFEMFLILYTVNVLVYTSQSKIFKLRQQIVLITLASLFFLSLFIINQFPALQMWSVTLGFTLTFKWFVFFVFGYVCSINKETFLRFLKNRYFAFAIIFLYVIGFYVNRVCIYPNINMNTIFRMGYHIISILIGVLGVLIVYNTFRIYQDSLDKKVGGILQYIGKRTLDIYLLHYFFLPYVPQLGSMLSEDKNAVLELAIGGGISLLVIGICLVVSNILRTSPILAKYLIGVRK